MKFYPLLMNSSIQTKFNKTMDNRLSINMEMQIILMNKNAYLILINEEGIQYQDHDDIIMRDRKKD